MSESLSNYWIALHNTERLAFHATLYAWAAAQIPSGRVLDLGCEYGFGTMLMAKTNAHLQVFGLDLDLAAMQYSRNIPCLQRIPRVNAEASLLPVASESLSGVFLINILHLVEEAGAILSEVRRVLRVGGAAIMSIPGEDLEGNEYNRHRLTQKLEFELQALFSQVMYPDTICGSIPSFPPQGFRVDQQTSTWIAFCQKH